MEMDYLFKCKGKNNNMEENVILFHLTLEQAETLCKYYNKDIKQLQEYEISQLLDRFINENI